MYGSVYGEAMNWDQRRTSRFPLKHFMDIKGKMLRKQLEMLVWSWAGRADALHSSSAIKRMSLTLCYVWKRQGGALGYSSLSLPRARGHRNVKTLPTAPQDSSLQLSARLLQLSYVWRASQFQLFGPIVSINLFVLRSCVLNFSLDNTGTLVFSYLSPTHSVTGLHILLVFR